jgi:hypothetical protein
MFSSILQNLPNSIQNKMRNGLCIMYAICAVTTLPRKSYENLFATLYAENKIAVGDKEASIPLFLFHGFELAQVL